MADASEALARTTLSSDDPSAAAAAPSWDDSATAAAPPPAGETPTCRFCFEEATEDEGGQLVAPCKCSGSQKYVHVQCLKRWQAHQRLEAASSRTPGGGRQKAITCDVCHSELTTAPPTDAELLAIVRPTDGRAVAALLGPGVLLGAVRTQRPDTSNMPAPLAYMLSRRAAHWIAHVFLLYSCDEGGANDGSDCIIGLNVTRHVSVNDKYVVTGASKAECIYKDALQDMIACSKDVQQAIVAARKAGVQVKLVLGGPCATKEIVCLHQEPAVDGSRLAQCPEGSDVRFGGTATAVLEAAMARVKDGASGVAVLLSFGHARWGRTQLQNEVCMNPMGRKWLLTRSPPALRLPLCCNRTHALSSL